MSKLNAQSTLKLNDGNEIPRIALGVYQTPAAQCEQAVLDALEAGYRHIDSAALYKNEEQCGNAIRQFMRSSGVKREEIFYTTKLWNSDHGYAEASKAIDESIRKSGLGYIDLYLIHSPLPGKDLRLESWKAMEDGVKAGKLKSIGVSNYGVHHITELLENCRQKPAVNQVELSPFLTRDDIVGKCEEEGIALEAYCPLTRGKRLEDPALVPIAKKYGKPVSKILLRWGLQRVRTRFRDFGLLMLRTLSLCRRVLQSRGYKTISTCMILNCLKKTSTR